MRFFIHRTLLATALLLIGIGGKIFAADAEVMAPYTGIVLKGVDCSTLTGKVLCGYQGWFGTPGDGSAWSGWRHWTKRRGPLEDGNANVDLWPDVSELSREERFATSFTLPNGKAGEVFSSYNPKTVERHFQWMRESGIDGVFVQRFASNLRNERDARFCDGVLANCRAGANLNGRGYAVMYDLSGLGAGEIEVVINDWKKLRREMTITDDPAYLHHHGKPVVAVWGIGFNDGRQYTLEDCARLLRFLKEDKECGGCTVMAGVPAFWRTLDGDAVKDRRLTAVIQMADIISPWTVGRYSSPAGAGKYGTNTLKPDLEWCGKRGKELLPVVFPGFGWHNMKGGPPDEIPRLRGKFLWSQFTAAKQAGASMVYVAMFDELDEGTAIFKCANEVPEGEKSKFTSMQGLAPDFYLRLAGAGARLLRGEISVSDGLPVK